MSVVIEKVATQRCEAASVRDDDLLTDRLLWVIDKGSRTATYELALLLGLIDAVALAPGESRCLPRPPGKSPTRRPAD
ncbi:hypothetical protein BH24ACT3_BH24ACT3_09690 [soil metagenome]